MANPVSSNQVIGAFTDVFEQIKDEVVELPKDVGQAAAETAGSFVGASSSGKKTTAPGAAADPGSTWQQLEQTEDREAKKKIARSALAEINQPSRQKEPDPWEQKQQEEAQKKEMLREQQEKQRNAIPMPTSVQKVHASVKVG